MQSPRMPSSPRPTRNVLLKIPNAKASRLGSDRETWTFLALGDFFVYQVQQLSRAKTPPLVPSRRGSAAAPPPVPPRAGETASSPAPIPVPQPVGEMSGSPTYPSLAPASGASTPSGTSGIVLAVRSTEFPISTTTTTTFEAPNTYILNNGEGFVVKIELDLPRTGSHEILDNVLRKYAHLGGSLDVPPAEGSTSSSGASTPELRPSDFKGSLLLVDETTGRILGPLNQSTPMVEKDNIFSNEAPNQMSTRDPVVVTFGNDSQDPDAADAQVQVSAFEDITSQFGKSDSRILGAAEYVSKGILFAADYGANATSRAAADYKARTKATDTPLVFSPTTKKAVASVAGGTEQVAKAARGAIKFFGNKVEALGTYAVNSGADGLKAVGIGGGDKAPSNPNAGWRGALKTSVKAALTVTESFEKGGKHFLETGRQSTNDVVQHRYGDEARDITDSLTSVGSNVVLVYVDARGVMHRALLKRVGKGALKARMKDGSEVVLDDSGMEGQHTTRDENGNLLVVDEKKGEAYEVDPVGGASYEQAGYSTGVQSAFGNGSTAQRRAPPAIPPRF